MSRRGFLTGASAAVIAAKIPAPLRAANEPVAIVGGGIAGLTAAFHLRRARIPCEVYEATARAGGRMFTKTMFNAEGMTCELGGELVDANHDDLRALCRFFEIPVDDFAGGDEGLASNLYLFSDGAGERRYRQDPDALEVMKIFNRRFAADADTATNGDASALDAMSLQAYLDTYRGEIDPWFLELLRVAYVGESGSEADQQTALNMITTLGSGLDSFHLYGDSDQGSRIRGGNQALISAMEAWLTRHGVAIHKNSPLTGIHASTNQVELNFGAKVVRARRVICAIPFSTLRRVDGIGGIGLGALKLRAIREVGYGTNGKLMLGFEGRAWREAHGAQPASNGMVYSDLFTQNVWETSRAQGGSRGILTTYLGGNAGAATSPHDREKTLAALARVFPGTAGRHDGNHACSNWARAPYNLGSYACLRPGQTTLFGAVAGQAELDGRLLFAGEHAAPKFNGFMNGAAMSGRLAAEALKF